MLKSKIQPEDKDKIGVYIVHNPTTLEMYSGSGILGQRERSHRLLLERGRLNNNLCNCGKSREKCRCRHFNSKLQEAYNRDPDNFYFFSEVTERPELSRLDNRLVALAMEQEDINEFKDSPLFLNIAKSVEAPRTNAEVSDETRLKMRLARNRYHLEKQLASGLSIGEIRNKQLLKEERDIEVEKRRTLREQRRQLESDKRNDPNYTQTKSFKCSENAKRQMQDPIKKKEILDRIHAATKMPISIEGTVYESQADAARKLCLTTSQIRVRIESDKFQDWNKIK